MINALLELSEEYDILKIRKIIERHFLKELREISNNKQKFYGSKLNDHIIYLMNLIRTSIDYRMKVLQQETIDHLVYNIDKKILKGNDNFNKWLDVDIKLEIFSRKLDILDEASKNKEKLMKTMKDENLRQKFEIQRLNKLIGET